MPRIYFTRSDGYFVRAAEIRVSSLWLQKSWMIGLNAVPDRQDSTRGKGVDHVNPRSPWHDRARQSHRVQGAEPFVQILVCPCGGGFLNWPRNAVP